MEVKAVANMVREAEKHADEQAKDRKLSDEYYSGEMSDTPAMRENRSTQTSRDLRTQVKKAMPSIVRTMLGRDQVVEYQPQGEGDEEGAAQATDYVNEIVYNEAKVRRAIKSAVHDALRHRNGILKWWWDEKKAVQYSRHTGLTEDELATLVAGDDVTVVEQETREEQIEQEVVDPMTGQAAMQLVDVTLYDVKTRRVFTDAKVKVAAIPRERFLIHPDATCIEDSICTGEKTSMRRSDLVLMGYDRKLVADLPLAGDNDEERDRRRDATNEAYEADAANEEVDYYDLYVRVDLDDDGIAELRHMVFAGGLSEDNLLENEEVDEVQICDLCADSEPHQWEGVSLFDDLRDVQRVKTVLLRQTLDNLYWANNPMLAGDPRALGEEGTEAATNPEFGRFIPMAGDPRAALMPVTMPFVAAESYGMLEYMDREGQERTGINDASSGLAPDALQNMTAKASAMVEAGGIGQIELMVAELAEGLKVFYRGLLRLIVRHQDKPRTVRLRKKWVTFDPRHWNAEMDAEVNIGLGAGTRERDMQMMMMVKQVQAELIAAFGPNNPYVSPENLYNTLAKLVESAGLKTPGLYFTEPDAQRVKADLEKAAAQPSPEQQKLQAQMQLERAKLETQVSKEKAQMAADLQVKQAEIQADTERQRNDLASKAALQEQQIAWEREKFAMELQAREREAAQARQNEILRHQAERFTASQEAANQPSEA